MGKLGEILAASAIHPLWRAFLASDAACLQALEKVDAAYTRAVEEGKTLFPAPAHIFRAFEQAPADVRCVILGQDPYHEVGQAMGLAFSVPNGTKCPPSLRNIKKELAADLGAIDLSGTDLTPWAKQGVFLLNTVLTVEEGKANAHAKLGWELLTHRALGHLAQCSPTAPLAAILWGAQAQKEAATLQEHPAGRPVLVLQSVHPSPLSANRGFFGSRPFSQVNAFLAQHGAAPLDWRIPG